MSEKQDVGTSPVVCGIGASAGGLEPLSRLLGALDSDIEAAFIVAQHMSPSYDSQLVKILDEASALPVVEAESGERIETGKVYVAPPNADVRIENGHIILECGDPAGARPSVSKLFASLAAQCHERAVAVVLSGAGSDGAEGLRAIRLASGVALVQDPAQAQYNGMPNAAIATHCTDMVLKDTQIAEVLSEILREPGELHTSMEQLSASSTTPLMRIATAVRRLCDIDLSVYKDGTLERRVQRRMAITRSPTLDVYEALLSDNAEEARLLANSVLISVTAFFRDPEVFVAAKDVLRQIVESRKAADRVRIWVPACATGEEAYSIAILYQEIANEVPGCPPLSLFASDMDESAVTVARAGVYREGSIGNLSKERLERFFTPVEGGWQVNKSLRQRIVFSVQNLIEDPPFSRMDLVSCRNLLIYLKPQVQKRIFEMLHYSLVPGGFLMLGKSESADSQVQLFLPVSKGARIYRRGKEPGGYRVAFSQDVHQLRVPRPAKQRNRQSRQDRARNVIQDAAHKVLSDHLEAVWAVIDQNDVVKCLSRDARPIFSLPEGPVMLRVYNLIHENLQNPVRALIYRARKENGSAEMPRCVAKIDGRDQAFDIAVVPFNSDDEPLWLVALLQRDTTPAEIGEDTTHEEAAAYIRDLEYRMERMVQDLNSTTEELETSNEELQSQAEELQSSNEELQSMNEQLLTTNEELQSSNEELLTMNDEVQMKSAQLEHAANALATLMGRLGMPVVLLDGRGRLTEYNEAAAVLGKLPAAGVPTPVQNIEWNFAAQDLVATVRKLVEKGSPDLIEEIKVAGEDQSWRVELASCLGENDALEGIVLQFRPL